MERLAPGRVPTRPVLATALLPEQPEHLAGILGRDVQIHIVLPLQQSSRSSPHSPEQGSRPEGVTDLRRLGSCPLRKCSEHLVIALRHSGDGLEPGRKQANRGAEQHLSQHFRVD